MIFWVTVFFRRRRVKPSKFKFVISGDYWRFRVTGMTVTYEYAYSVFTYSLLDCLNKITLRIRTKIDFVIVSTKNTKIILKHGNSLGGRQNYSIKFLILVQTVQPYRPVRPVQPNWCGCNTCPCPGKTYTELN